MTPDCLRCESGHSVVSGLWTRVDARASTYDGHITSVKFGAGSWLVTNEKPLVGKAVNWKAIGKDKSLFSWWIQEGYASCFPGAAVTLDPGEFAYTICDDGAGELGDFVVFAKHSSFATETNPSQLALILVHMKGASKSANRQMAPKQYEEVLGQGDKKPDLGAFSRSQRSDQGGSPGWQKHALGMGRDSLQAASRSQEEARRHFCCPVPS